MARQKGKLLPFSMEAFFIHNDTK